VKKNYGIALGVCFIILYVGIRSFNVDITHDEAYSFHNMKHFWYVEALCTANTHWLNSLAIKTALLFHLESNWQIRWFSILSAIVFFTISFLWISSFEKAYQKVFACSVLLFNPYVLDYFGLARGYASGLMFEALAMFLFVISLNKQNRLMAFAALFCAGLSTIANYSFVYFFAGFTIVYFYAIYFKQKSAFLKNKSFYIDTALCLAVSLFIIRAWIFIIKCSNDLGAGTDSITEACSSILEGLLYQKLNLTNTAAIVTTCILIAFVTVICTYGIVRFKQHRNELYFYSCLIFSIVLFITTINFFCFKVVLPYARSALFMFPLVSINLICFITEVFKPSFKKLTMTALSILLLFNFFRMHNLTHTFDFSAQWGTKKVFNYLDSIGADRIAMSRETYGVYINYYQMTDRSKYRFKGDFILEAKDITAYNYFLLSPPYLTPPNGLDHLRFDTIKRFRDNNIILLKVKQQAGL
jgi:hypothetical protein